MRRTDKHPNHFHALSDEKERNLNCRLASKSSGNEVCPLIIIKT